MPAIINLAIFLQAISNLFNQLILCSFDIKPFLVSFSKDVYQSTVRHSPVLHLFILLSLQYGYTFVGEARSVDLPLNGGKWRMRLIGSSTPLPQPSRENLHSSFIVKEIRDYYIPNKNFVILRFVKVTLLSSIDKSIDLLGYLILHTLNEIHVECTDYCVTELGISSSFAKIFVMLMAAFERIVLKNVIH